MRKRTKRFMLSRETVRALDRVELVRVAGQTGSADTTVACFEASWCACETQGCGTTGSLCPSVTVCSNC